MQQYESVRNQFPTGGQGTLPGTTQTSYDLQSTITLLLPYLEATAQSELMNLKYAYNDKRAPANQVATKTQLEVLLCPSNAHAEPDPQGYGQTNYVPTVFTDLDPVTGVSNNATRMDGALALGGTRLSRITDGLSHTTAIAECSPVNYETVFPFIVSGVPDPVVSAGNDADAAPPSKSRATNRWAEPDSGIGISGPGNAAPGDVQGRGQQ